jgi:hypothetical protein
MYIYIYIYIPLIFTAFFPDFDAVNIDKHIIYIKPYGYVSIYIIIYIYIPLIATAFFPDFDAVTTALSFSLPKYGYKCINVYMYVFMY